MERVRSFHVLRLVEKRVAPRAAVAAGVQRSRVPKRMGGRAVAAGR